jgi:hypothetical protein
MEMMKIIQYSRMELIQEIETMNRTQSEMKMGLKYPIKCWGPYNHHGCHGNYLYEVKDESGQHHFSQCWVKTF